MDDIRQRFLRDRIMTATPVQRVVMLYDRLALDLTRADAAGTPADAQPHLAHASEIVAQLLSSLDHSIIDGPADNLANIYHFVLRGLLVAQTSGSRDGLGAISNIIAELGSAWAQIAAGDVAADAYADIPRAQLAGSWTA